MKRILLALGAVTALVATPAFAAWDLSRISGPWQVPIYGAPRTDGQGNTYTPITGYQPGVVFVIPASAVTPALQAYVEAVPVGVPILAGVPSVALAFASEAAAEGPLAAYWTADAP